MKTGYTIKKRENCLTIPWKVAYYAQDKPINRKTVPHKHDTFRSYKSHKFGNVKIRPFKGTDNLFIYLAYKFYHYFGNNRYAV